MPSLTSAQLTGVYLRPLVTGERISTPTATQKGTSPANAGTSHASFVSKAQHSTAQTHGPSRRYLTSTETAQPTQLPSQTEQKEARRARIVELARHGMGRSVRLHA